MGTRSRLMILAALVAAMVLVFGSLTGGSIAQEDEGDGPGARATSPPAAFNAQHMVKFVCGWLPPVPPQEDQHAKPGDYATAINVGNYTNVTRAGSYRVMLHYRDGAPLPPFVPPVGVSAGKFRTLEIDCTSIWRAAGLPPGTFVKGFVHLGFPVQFPVTAVYTMQTHVDPLLGPDPGAGASIDVEQIAPWVGGIAG